MTKKLSAAVVALCLLGMTACSPDPSGSSFGSSRQQEETPSLTVTVEGEQVLLVDMSDPLVRDFFSGCDGFDLDALDIVVESMETRQKTPVRIDPRYTYPMYDLDFDKRQEGAYLGLAEKLLGGERMAEHIQQAEIRQWEGILFDETGFPVSIGIWGEEGYGHYAPVADEMNRYEAPDRVDAFINYFGGHILIMTDEIRAELQKRGFDLSKTTVKGGWFGYPGFFFTDGENELVRVTGDTKEGSYTIGAYLTPREIAQDAIEFAAAEQARRETEPPLAPGENPPTG